MASKGRIPKYDNTQTVSNEPRKLNRDAHKDRKLCCFVQVRHRTNSVLNFLHASSVHIASFEIWNEQFGRVFPSHASFICIDPKSENKVSAGDFSIFSR